MSTKPPIEVPQVAIRLNTDSQSLEFFAQDRWYEFATNTPILDGGARGLACGGNAPTHSNGIEFITIATLGNAKDFGDLLAATSDFGPTGFSSPTRGVVAGGGGITTIQYVKIMTTGNSKDFGDLTAGNQYGAGASNGHGGLG